MRPVFLRIEPTFESSFFSAARLQVSAANCRCRFCRSLFHRNCGCCCSGAAWVLRPQAAVAASTAALGSWTYFTQRGIRRCSRRSPAVCRRFAPPSVVWRRNRPCRARARESASQKPERRDCALAVALRREPSSSACRFGRCARVQNQQNAIHIAKTLVVLVNKLTLGAPFHRDLLEWLWC